MYIWQLLICYYFMLYITDPQVSMEFPQDYLERVKATHENGGGFGSTGLVSHNFLGLALFNLFFLCLKLPIQLED